MTPQPRQRDDRRVHARLNSFEVVRYDRAGKWYIESTTSGIPRRQITLKEAVSTAIYYAHVGGEMFVNVPGGGAFDAKVRQA